MAKKICMYVLILTLISTAMPVQNIWANATTATNKVDLFTLAVTDQENVDIQKGEKNIDYRVQEILFMIGSGYILQSQNHLNDVKVFGGSEDETYKFDIKAVKGQFQLKLKTGIDGTASPYQLKKHTLYQIVIPEGLFIKNDGTEINMGENFTFVTNAESWGEDIMSSSKIQHLVDHTEGKLRFTFIHNITFTDQNRLQEDISITAVDMVSGNSKDSFTAFDIQTVGNTLELTAKTGKLEDLTQYKVHLNEKTVFLDNNPDVDGKIYNGVVDAIFYTDDIVESTDPLNGSTNAELQQLITFRFKDSVAGDLSGIKMNEVVSGAEIPITISLSPDSKELFIEVEEENILKKDTEYRVTIPKETFTLSGMSTANATDIMLSFKTGMQGDSPKALAYGSNESFADDIQDASKTQLSENGYIYIKMDRSVRWVKNWSGDEKISDRLKKIELFKIPAVDPNDLGAKAYGKNGVQYDKEFWYMKDGGTFKLATTPDDGKTVAPSVYYKEKMAIESIDIVGLNKDILRVKSKFPLLSSNQYQLRIYGSMIEDLYGVNGSGDIDFNFWVKENADNSISSWEFSYKSPAVSRIISTSPYIKQRIHGTQKYSSSDPIVISMDAELIPSAKAGKVINNTYYQNSILENILFRPTNYAKGTITIGATLLDASPIAVDTTVQFKLDEEINPKGETVSWMTKNESIAVVDANGIVKGIKKGQTQILALDEDSDILTTINVTVEDGSIGIGKIRITYEETNSGKKTVVRLYPNEPLINGMSYKLFIPGDVFQTRGKTFAPAWEVELVVSGSASDNPAIQTIENGTVSIADLLNKAEYSFSIKGYNFRKDVEQVILRSNNNSNTHIEIPGSHVEFMGTDQLKVTLKNTAREDLIRRAEGDDYIVTVIFKDIDPIESPSGVYFKTLTMGAPSVIGKYPDENGTYDEKGLIHKETQSFVSGRYFLRITFSDPDGSLDFNGVAGLNNIINSNVVSVGSSSSMIDVDFVNQILDMGEYNRNNTIHQYLFIKNTSSKEAVLYIPIKLLRSQATYQVTLRPGIVLSNAGANKEIIYQFSTKNMPYVEKVSIGTVPEKYDVNEPIILEGDFFDSSSKVYFNDIAAYKQEPKERTNVDGTKKIYLEVYLPRGRDKLSPGIYNIKVTNTENNQYIEYGALSVVEAGDTRNIPNEDYRYKDEIRQGDIKASTKVSQDTLYLEARYRDDAHVSMDLDEMMGTSVWGRKITYGGDKKYKIGTLETKSKWADIVLYGLTLDTNAAGEMITVALGRVEPGVAQSLQKKIKGTIKSDFIQVTGENFKISSVNLSIPYKDSNGKNLKVYRYDEETRSLYKINGAVDVVNGKVKIASSEPGIFVVVE